MIPIDYQALMDRLDEALYWAEQNRVTNEQMQNISALAKKALEALPQAQKDNVHFILQLHDAVLERMIKASIRALANQDNTTALALNALASEYSKAKNRILEGPEYPLYILQITQEDRHAHLRDQKKEVGYVLFPHLSLEEESALGLDRYSLFSAIEFLSEVFVKIVDSHPSFDPNDVQRAKDILALLQQASNWAICAANARAEKAMGHFDLASSHLRFVNGQVLETIRQLPVGHHFCFPGSVPNHAFLYKIIKTDPERVSIEVIDTGFGIFNGDRKIHFATYNGIRIDELLHSDFFFEIQAPQIEKGQAISAVLQKYPFMQNASITLGPGYEPNFRSTCAFQSVWVYLQTNISPLLFHIFQVELTRAMAARVQHVFQDVSPGQLEMLQSTAEQTLRRRVTALLMYN